MQEPVEVYVGDPYFPPRLSGSKRSLVEKRDSFQYVPLLNTLRNLLTDATVLEYIENPHQRTDGLLEDICDGELFKSHPLFSTDQHALQIIAYYDELEVCNPLGTHTKKHKLGIVLFMLGNIPPKYRSTLKSMNLIACAEYPVVHKHGLDAILKPFVEDLNVLSSVGITVNVNGVERTFRGGLISFLADNAASNALGGFKESFSFSFRFCRTCMATNESFRIHFLPHHFVARTDANHKRHCEEVSGALGDHFSKTYGVNRRSKLCDINGYSLFGGGLPHDFMHDILEGIAQYEIKLILRYCIESKFFTLEEYNHRILYFNYGSTETDKPGIVTSQRLRSDDKSFHLSSAQTLLLCRILPLLIGERVPQDNQHWKCFLLLLKIVHIVACPVISKGCCAYLRVLIDEHHSTFRDLYTSNSITPKQHFIVHYPDQMLSVGPMVRTWTMRHEAKLNFFKRAARLGNFKNIAQSLANRHQRWLCYQASSGNLLHSQFLCGPCGSLQILSDEPETVASSIRSVLPFISDHATISHPKWVEKDGIRYHTNNCYLITGSDNIDPVFSRIIDVLVASGNMLLFQVQLCSVNYYDEHFHSYVVSELPCVSVVSVEDLCSPFVLHGHSLFNGTKDIYITLRNAFISRHE